MKHVLPKILWAAIEDVYQTTFTLLSNFGKQQLNKTKRKIIRSKYLLLYILYLQ